MKTQEIIKALRKLKVNTGAFALNCLGCGYEHNCSIHGCNILKTAADRLEELQKENNTLISKMLEVSRIKSYETETSYTWEWGELEK